MQLGLDFTGTENDLLVITDAQTDFTYGVLGTREAIEALPGMKNFIINFKGKKVWTKDTHDENYLNTQEGKLLPVPHTTKGTKGWRIDPSIAMLVRENTTVFEKPIFGSEALFDYIKANDFTRIYFIGFCTGICVISNAVLARTADPEAEIHIVKNLCACVDEGTHEVALAAMRTLQMSLDTYDFQNGKYDIVPMSDGKLLVERLEADGETVTDDEAYQNAVIEGIRFIHVTELDPHLPDDMRHGRWLDTALNRTKLTPQREKEN